MAQTAKKGGFRLVRPTRVCHFNDIKVWKYFCGIYNITFLWLLARFFSRSVWPEYDIESEIS